VVRHILQHDLQLGAVITQENRPVAYYSRKLNSAQRNYTVGEKEIHAVVETLNEYRNMLYGRPYINVYTDHKNNAFIGYKLSMFYAGNCFWRTTMFSSIT
jgi:RNase H-like domain found in reverse transcriptase